MSTKQRSPKTALKQLWAAHAHLLARNLNQSCSLRWKPRKGVWERPNLIFNPATGLGTSYAWYNIAQIIDGCLYLNNYRYSVTTAKHVRELRGLFNILGLHFRELAAPAGLQNLDRALDYAWTEWARINVRLANARKPDWSGKSHWEKQIALLEKLGARASYERAKYIETVEHFYQRDLARKRTNRAEKRKRDLINERITSASNAKEHA